MLTLRAQTLGVMWTALFQRRLEASGYSMPALLFGAESADSVMEVCVCLASLLLLLCGRGVAKAYRRFAELC